MTNVKEFDALAICLLFLIVMFGAMALAGFIAEMAEKNHWKWG